jgi:hypothetical protein
MDVMEKKRGRSLAIYFFWCTHFSVVESSSPCIAEERHFFALSFEPLAWMLWTPLTGFLSLSSFRWSLH